MNTLRLPLTCSTFAFLLLGCAYEPPPATAPSDGGGRGFSEGAEPRVVVEPFAPLDAVPRVARLRVAAPASLDESALRLFEGELSEGQLPHAAASDLPETLASRRVPALVFSEGDELVLAPTLPLQASARYTLVDGATRLAVLTVAADDDVETLALAWPPEGRSPSGLLAIYCGDQGMEHVSFPTTLAPGGVPGVFRPGVAPGEPSRRCVHFEPAVAASDGSTALLPPLRLATGVADDTVALAPTPLVRAPASPSLVLPVACAVDEVPFGPGCARVEDDRLLLRPPSASLLWSIQSAPMVGVEQVFSTDGRPLVVWPLPSDSVVWLVVSTIDTSGGVRSAPALLRTAAPRAHFVIDEVLANPVGPEPAQEWVELVNDGSVAGSLAGLRLADVGGEVVLPDVLVPPGGRVLVVGDAFEPSSKFDPAPAPGTPLVRVPALGKDGLGNAGEPLELLAPDGAPLSSFPAVKTKAGRSVYRVATKSLNDFATSTPGGATPGAPNDAMTSEAPR